SRTLLVDTHSSVNDYREKLAQSLMAVAPPRFEAGRGNEGVVAIPGGLELFRGPLDPSDPPPILPEPAPALPILACVPHELSDNTQALAAFDAARVAEEQALHDAPESEPYKKSLIEILQNLGEQSADLGDVTEGLPHYRRAVQIRRELLKSRTGDRV